MQRVAIAVLSVLILSQAHLGMARHGQYDEEAREYEKQVKTTGERNNPVTGVAGGVKTATVDTTKDLFEGAAEGSASTGGPITGTLEGARVGGSKAVETAAKGVFKVATLGYGDTENMKVEEPRKDTDDVTKFSINW